MWKESAFGVILFRIRENRTSTTPNMALVTYWKWHTMIIRTLINGTKRKWIPTSFSSMSFVSPRSWTLLSIADKAKTEPTGAFIVNWISFPGLAVPLENESDTYGEEEPCELLKNVITLKVKKLNPNFQ